MASYLLLGDACIAGEGKILLTKNENDKVGACFLTSKRPCYDFENVFTFKITKGGADGFSFIIHNNEEAQIGVGGSGLGYAGIANCIAIEFDTWNSGFEMMDANSNHISIQSRGKDKNSSHHDYALNNLVSNNLDFQINDGIEHSCIIRYNEMMETLTIHIDDKLCLSNNCINISQILQTNSLTTAFFVGFTASTGGLNQTHEISNWHFESKEVINCPQFIYRLMSAKDFSLVESSKIFDGHKIDEKDGYMHFSLSSQLAKTAQLYFTGVLDLLVCEVDITAIPSAVTQMDYVEKRFSYFPHVISTYNKPSYFSIPLEAFTKVIPMDTFNLEKDKKILDNNFPYLPKQPKFFKTRPIMDITELNCWNSLNDPKLLPMSENKLHPKIKDNKKTNKLIVCHDYNGNYHEDATLTCNNVELQYQFKWWGLIDIFIYFSHYLVTIPPVGLIEAAHSNGVKMIGTIITENAFGVEFTDELISNPSKYVKILTDICIFFGFDGYLVNIEVDLKNGEKDVNKLVNFVSLLSRSVKRNVKNGIVLWYDSVSSITGKVQYQNSLNEHNLEFFNCCDGIFTNYWWSEEKAIASASVASYERSGDVYMGIDVFGRKTFLGGGWDTSLALDVAFKNKTSAAIFAPAWTLEFLGKELFNSNDSLFWKLIKDVINKNNSYIQPKSCEITHLPFSSSFSIGSGTSFYKNGYKLKPTSWCNLKLQDMCANMITNGGSVYVEVENDFENVYNYGNSILINCNESKSLRGGKMKTEEGSCCYFSFYNTNIPLEIRDVIKEEEEIIEISLYFKGDNEQFSLEANCEYDDDALKHFAIVSNGYRFSSNHQSITSFPNNDWLTNNTNAVGWKKHSMRISSRDRSFSIKSVGISIHFPSHCACKGGVGNGEGVRVANINLGKIEIRSIAKMKVIKAIKETLNKVLSSKETVSDVYYWSDTNDEGNIIVKRSASISWSFGREFYDYSEIWINGLFIDVVKSMNHSDFNYRYHHFYLNDNLIQVKCFSYGDSEQPQCMYSCQYNL